MNTNARKNKSIAWMSFMLLLLTSLNPMRAQLNMPVLIRHLSFDDIASSKNTMNDDHLPMQFISSIECTFSEEEDETAPVEVYFNANNDLEKKSCVIMKWDASIRRWKKFQGGNIHQEKEGSDRYFRCTIQESGTYALFKKFDHNGKTTITLPSSYQVTDWKFSQRNVGIVCEGHLMSPSIQIPFPEISPAADLELSIMDAESKPHDIKGLKVGEILPQIWSKNGQQENTLHLTKKQFTIITTNPTISSSL
ncbi:MAG: hypothetical protein ACKO6L_06320 [Flavobacteriales bacterium]